jgi:hypothetical protein
LAHQEDRLALHAASNIGGISRLFDDSPEDFPSRNQKTVTPAVILADVDEPDEVVLPSACNRKCVNKQLSVELLVVLLAGELPLALSFLRRLGEPWF